MIRLKRLSNSLIDSIAGMTFQRPFVDTLNSKGVIVILQGPRGVGKTTALLQYLREQSGVGEKSLLVSADSVLIGDIKLFDIADRFVSEGGQILAIDEIHKKEMWDSELKTIFDSFPGLKLVVSGSSSLLKIEKADLSRRAVKIKCNGLSFREWLNMTYDLTLKAFEIEDLKKRHTEFAEEIVNGIKSKKISIIENFKTYLQYGYFPTSFGLEDWIYFETLNESVNKTITQDILSCYPMLSGKTIQRLHKVLSILAAKCPYVPDINDLTRSLELSDQKTTKQYLFYLHEAKIIREVAKQGKTVSALNKPEKIYLDNTNYIYALSRSKHEIGTIRETFLANVLSVYCEMNGLEDLKVPKKGDFILPDQTIFEVGGKSKSYSQINKLGNAFLCVDDIEFGEERKIPLWLFGFLW